TTGSKPRARAFWAAAAMKPTWPSLAPAGASTIRWWLISSSSSCWSGGDRAHLRAGSPTIATFASGDCRRRSATAAVSCANDGVARRHPATVSASTGTTLGRALAPPAIARRYPPRSRGPSPAHEGQAPTGFLRRAPTLTRGVCISPGADGLLRHLRLVRRWLHRRGREVL